MENIKKPMKYENGKIYTIRSPQCEKYYIGSTTQPLCKRLAKHKLNYDCYQTDDVKNNYMTSFEILQYVDSYIELLENYPCKSKEELNKREGELIRLHKEDIVNKNVAGRTRKEYRDENKAKIKDYNKVYFQQNKIQLAEQRKEYVKKYQQDNREKIREQRKEKCVCLCGCEYTRIHKSRHEQSKKHIKLLTEKQ